MTRKGFNDFTSLPSPPQFSIVYFRTRYYVSYRIRASTSKPSREQRSQQPHSNYRASRFRRFRPCCCSLKRIPSTPSRSHLLVCRRIIRSSPSRTFYVRCAITGSYTDIPRSIHDPSKAYIDPCHSSGHCGPFRSITSVVSVSVCVWNNLCKKRKIS